MLEILTSSGAIVRADNATPPGALRIAVSALGGAVAEVVVDTSRETVLQIMDSMVIGTVLTSESGKTYKLQPDNRWHIDGADAGVPPFESIVKATMPGGWTWLR